MIGKIGEVIPGLSKRSPELDLLLGKLKELEYAGYQFEAATASFEMVVLKELGRFQPFFTVELFRIIGEQDSLFVMPNPCLPLRKPSKGCIT